MTQLPELDDAYAVLGLEPGADQKAIKAAFRARIKTLHPDVSIPSPETLSELARVIAAAKTLEKSTDSICCLTITPVEAARGVTRIIPQFGQNLIVRIPAGTKHETIIQAVGQDTHSFSIGIAVAESNSRDNTSRRSALPEFAERYASPSPAARFASWLRRKSTAA